MPLSRDNTGSTSNNTALEMTKRSDTDLLASTVSIFLRAQPHSANSLVEKIFWATSNHFLGFSLGREIGNFRTRRRTQVNKRKKPSPGVSQVTVSYKQIGERSRIGMFERCGLFLLLI